ncbi:helix-turn-helix domain-containing protein [Arachidicoccus sp.]|uniref:helix-turn-helix domain-containing protein n=1 Tax=Arachidicoccus sp. TaxID=1872624 RepID=UPI003D1B070F
MSAFDILTTFRDRFEWNNLPYKKRGHLYLPDSEVISLHSSWSDMHFHFWDRLKYILYLNFYDVRGGRTTHVQSSDATVEYTLMLVGEAKNRLGGFKQNNIRPSFFNISYLSSIDSVTEFMAGQFYCTLDIHLKEIFILELLREFPEIMEPFVNSIERKQSRFLYPSHLPITLFMDDIANSIVNALRFGGSLSIVDKNVETMIAHALTYTNTENHKNLDIYRRQLMNEIYFKLMEDPFNTPEIKKLCKVVGMNATTLRQIFRKTFNMTIHQCWIKLKLDDALYMIAKDRNKLIVEVSKEVGFSCLANFSKAFKIEHKIAPSHLQKYPDFFDLFANENF